MGDERIVDCRGLKCPLPVLRASRALRAAAPGTVLRVETTDPLAGIDIPNLVRETGDVLETSHRDGDVAVFRIRKV